MPQASDEDWPAPRGPFSRASLLAWVRNLAPDLRIGKQPHCEHPSPNGGGIERRSHRRCFAGFTFAGEWHELVTCEETSPDPDEEIVKLCAEALRRVLRMPAMTGRAREPGIEQRILAADLAGDAGGVAALTREMLTGRPAEPAHFPKIRPAWGRQKV